MGEECNSSSVLLGHLWAKSTWFAATKSSRWKLAEAKRRVRMETEASEVDWVEIAAFYVVGLVVIVLAPLIGFDNPFWLVGVTMGLGLIAYGLKLQQPTRRWVSTTVRLCCVAGIFIGVIGAWFGPLWYQLVLPVALLIHLAIRTNPAGKKIVFGVLTWLFFAGSNMTFHAGGYGVIAAIILAVLSVGSLGLAEKK